MIAEDNSIVVGMADLKIAKTPIVISTNLGSCIAVCLYSATQKVGGMLHIMLARAGNARLEPDFKKAKFADSGMEEMLKQLQRSYGIEPADVCAKIFGGAKMLPQVTCDIGHDNEVAVRAILKDLSIPVVSSRTGGSKGYRIWFDLENGKVVCQVFGEEKKEY